jgi:DNA primase
MVKSYRQSMMEDSSEAVAARSYLDGRGLSMLAALSYQIGLVNTEFDEHASYAGMLCFPYQTKLGGVVSLKFRSLHAPGSGEKKYISPYPTRLYNTQALDRSDQLGYVAICEGEIDAITLDALCGIPAVGIPGVDTWKAHPEWRELFRGYRKVYVFADNDEPGMELARVILKDIDTASLVKLPGKDVNDTYLRFGAKAIKERINA